MRHLRYPRLHPACSLRVVVDPVSIRVVRHFEIPRALQRRPVCCDKFPITADLQVVVHRHRKQRSRIRSRILIGQRLPWHQIGGLRALVHNLSVGALVLQQEGDLLFRRLEVAVAVHRVERPQRIAAKKPTEARAIDIA